MTHIMIDLETLDTAPSAVFMSAALVCFDLETGMTSNEIVITFDLEDSFKYGRTISGKTLQWWLEQDASVLRQNFIAPYDLHDGLKRLYRFITLGQYNVEGVWGNSAKFDLGILEHAFNQVNIPVPWSFRQERCYRTINALFEDPNPTDNPRAHDPIADCHNQIARLCRIWQTLKNKPL